MNTPSKRLKKIEAFFEKNEVPETPGPVNAVHVVQNLRKYVEIARVRIHKLDYNSREFREVLRNLRYIAKNLNKQT